MKYKEEYRQYLSEKCDQLSKVDVGSDHTIGIISTVLGDIEQIEGMEAGPLFDLLYEKLQEKCKWHYIVVIPYHQFAANNRDEELNKIGI